MTRDTGEIAIRGVRVADIPGLHGLCRDLGYDTAVEPLPARLNAIVSDPNQAVYVAETTTHGLCGFVHLFIRHALEAEPCAQVQALVVSPGARGAGVARRLVSASESWAQGRGVSWLSLYSTTTREEAHLAYPALGFEAAATATRFNKRLE